MKYSKLLVLFMIIAIPISCDKVDRDDTDLIIPRIELTSKDIPAFQGMTQTYTGIVPRGVIKIASDDYCAEYEYRWESDNGSYAYIDIRILEDHEQAVSALTELHKSYTNPFIAESIDEPALVGNISYMSGREFIRNNQIVRIDMSDTFSESVTEIAMDIDSKLLKTTAFNSLTQVKPVIEEFSLETNPVIENSQTPFVIITYDPNDTEITYQWRFDNNSRYGGITQDDSGNYYFDALWSDPECNTLELTIIAINEYGFCSDASIEIEISEE